jgi:hypothetical protein
MDAAAEPVPVPAMKPAKSAVVAVGKLVVTKPDVEFPVDRFLIAQSILAADGKQVISIWYSDVASIGKLAPREGLVAVPEASLLKKLHTVSPSS